MPAPMTQPDYSFLLGQQPQAPDPFAVVGNALKLRNLMNGATEDDDESAAGSIGQGNLLSRAIMRALLQQIGQPQLLQYMGYARPPRPTQGKMLDQYAEQLLSAQHKTALQDYLGGMWRDSADPWSE